MNPERMSCHEALRQELREWFGESGLTPRFDNNWKQGVEVIRVIFSIFEKSALPASFCREVASEFRNLPKSLKNVAWGGTDVWLERVCLKLESRQDPPPRPWPSRVLRWLDSFFD